MCLEMCVVPAVMGPVRALWGHRGGGSERAPGGKISWAEKGLFEREPKPEVPAHFTSLLSGSWGIFIIEPNSREGISLTKCQLDN